MELAAHDGRAALLLSASEEAAAISAGRDLGGVVLHVPDDERAIVVNGEPVP